MLHRLYVVSKKSSCTTLNLGDVSPLSKLRTRDADPASIGDA